MQYQSSLGSVNKDNRRDVAMNGYTAIGRVLKVHHKRNTADVKLVKTNDIISGLPQNEGRFSCKILVNQAHFDIKTGKSCGVIEPISEGELVILSFIGGMKSQPLILGSIHRMDNTDNILSRTYPIEQSNRREYKKFLRVFPSQDYVKVDGDGNIELSLHGKSFIKVSDDNLNDTHKGYDSKDLTEKDKFTGNTLTMEDSSYQTPKNFLAVFRDNWNDSVTTWTKVYVPSSGMLRVTRDNNDGTLTYNEISRQGQTTIRRQLDSSFHGSGSNYSQISINTNGEIKAERVTSDKTTSITINESHGIEINITDGATITISPDGQVSINTEKGISMSAVESISINSSKSISLSAPKVNIN